MNDLPTIVFAREQLERELSRWASLPEGLVNAARDLISVTTGPKRGERCLDPQQVHRLMFDVARRPVEEFHVILLDVRGHLIDQLQIAVGSLSQCPVSPRDVLRPAVRAGAHGIVFVHNHPSGDPTPSADDADLTDRLRAATELVGIAPRDHVIVAGPAYYSFVEAGRWRR